MKFEGLAPCNFNKSLEAKQYPAPLEMIPMLPSSIETYLS